MYHTSTSLDFNADEEVWLSRGPQSVSTINTFRDGTDQENGADIEIDAGNLVREGEAIYYYDYNSGDYHSGNVESMESNGGSTSYWCRIMRPRGVYETRGDSL